MTERENKPQNTRHLRPELPLGYQCVRVLGFGGLGVAVLAKRNGQKVVIKLARTDLPSEDSMIRLLYSGASLQMNLRHENIVRVYDLSLKPFYLIMEYCEGGNLWEQASGKSLEKIVALVVKTGVGIGRALWVLHKYNIVHLDIKPENILFQKTNKTLIPKLSDFGISRSLGSLSSMATLLYIPRGSELPIIADPRVDLYQLCLSLYFVLATVTSRKAEKSYLFQLKEKPISIKDFWAGMPNELDHILLKGIDMGKGNFSEGYQNAKELVSDFRKIAL